MLIVENEEDTWMKKIVDYIINKTVSLNKSEARRLRMKSTRYCMFGGSL